MGKHRATEEGVVGYGKQVFKRYRKSIVAAGSAAVTTVIAVYTDGITQEEWTFILIQVGAALGVWGIPNATKKERAKE